MTLAQVPLRGHAVLLEPLQEQHAPALWAAAQRVGESGALTRIPHSLEDTRQYVRDALSEYHKGLMLPYATLDLRRGEVVGSTRFGAIERWNWGTHPNQVLPRVADVVEIGWTWLAADAQRTAINTEAKLLMLSHAFEVLGVQRVFLKTDSRNQRSRNAILRIGATFEGILRRHMPAYDGAIRDTAMYSIIAPEWQAVKAELERKTRATRAT